MDSAQFGTIRRPFIEHVQEVRRRLIWSSVALLIGGGVGYSLYERLLDLIQRPLGQTLYYTSPTGGFNFAFKICIVFGLIFALPVMSFHMFKFLEPVTTKESRHSILKYVLWSVILAYAGVMFGYYISLPAALNFLTQFGGENIQSLITANEYFSFALAYVAGFALLFQLPLLILFVNRVTPLKPSGMFKAQKYVILGSFIVAAILTPTPDPINQLLMALPIILLYQVSIIVIWVANRSRKNINLIEAQPLVNARVVEAVDQQSMDIRPIRYNPSTQFADIRRTRASIDGVVSARVRPQPRPQRPESSINHIQEFKKAVSQPHRVKLIDITV